MGQLTHHRAGRFADAVRAHVAPAEGRASAPVPAFTFDAPQVLAAMLDLRGSVQLEGALAARRAESSREGLPSLSSTRLPASAPSLPGLPSRGPSLLGRDYVRARLEGIEATHARRLSRPFEGRIRVPDAAATHAQIAWALASRAPGDVRAAARTLAGAFRELLVAAIERLLADVAALRDEIADDVRAHGPRAARLEALDRTLRASTASAMERLIERLGASTERALTLGFSRAIRALPDEADAGSLGPWFAADGLVTRALTQIRTLALSLLGHERAVLEALSAPPRERGVRGDE